MAYKLPKNKGLAQASNGFTLLELLLAIVLLAIVLSLTYGAYNSSFSVIDNARANAAYAERARVTLDRIGDDLASLYAGGDNPVFEGTTQTYGDYRGDLLAFTSTAHLIFKKDGRRVPWTMLAYRAEQEDDGLFTLYRVDMPYLPDDDSQISEQEGVLLCDGLREFAIYYVNEDGDKADTWDLESTKTTAPYPAMVKVRLGFADETDETKTIYYTAKTALPPVGE